MRKVSVFAVALVIALLATAAWGQGGQPGPGGANRPNRGPGMGGMGRGGGFCTAMAVMPPQSMFFERNAEELQLDDSQKTKLKEDLTKSEQSMVLLIQKATKASTALRTGLLSTDCDATKFKGLLSDAQAAEAAILTARLDTWTKVKADLKPEQLAKMQDLMTRPRDPGPGGPGGPGVPPGPGAPPPPPPPPAEGGGGPPPPAPPAQ